MSTQYAKGLPLDKNGNSMQNYPANVIALQRYGSENGTASSVLSFTDNTSAIEVGTSGGNGAVLKWIAASDTQASVISAAGTANYDHYIPANSLRRFVIPQETQGVSSVVGVNTQAGLYKRVAIKSAGISSVLTSEY